MPTTAKMARWIQTEVLSGKQAAIAGTPGNPDVHDLAGTNAEVEAANSMGYVYVLEIESTSSTANLEGLTDDNGNEPNPGTILVLTTGTSAPTNAVTVEDGNTGATAPFSGSGGTDDTYNAANETAIYIYDGDSWEHTATGSSATL